MLLSGDSGHFSLVKALHLADLITELNGTAPWLSLFTHTHRHTHPLSLEQETMLTRPPEGFCGVMSIFSSMRYCLGDPFSTGNLWAALAFMPLGLFFDFMDGKVARWRGKSSLMGQELDSLADLVCLTYNCTPPQILLVLFSKTQCEYTNVYKYTHILIPLRFSSRSPSAFLPQQPASRSGCAQQ